MTTRTVDATTEAAGPAADMRVPQWAVAALAAAALAGLCAAAWATTGRTLGLAVLIGALAGVSLYHAAFGFTAGWRRFIRERRGAGLRAQFWLVGATAVIAMPLIGYGDLIGVRAWGYVFPVGIAVAVGAFMFGLGMQLAGGCGSGTLFTVGGGSTRMVITLAFFIAGGLLATYHWVFWAGLPRLPATSLARTLTPWGGVAVTLAVLAALWALSRRAEWRAHGNYDAGRPFRSLWRGPWSPAVGVVGLTAVGGLTLAVLGRPWGITSGLTLWGAQIAHAAGVPVEAWPYWTNAMAAVEGSPLRDGTSAMNFGLIAGATLAAGLAGHFRPTLALSTRDVLTAMAGGLLMGYGARIAFGCNIGAFLGGVASGSLHGWLWLVLAFVGSIAGVWLRERIGVDPPRAAAH